MCALPPAITCRGRRLRRPFAFPPQGGRWHARPDEGATYRFVLGGHIGPPLRAATGRNFRRGGPMWPPAGAPCAPLRMVRPCRARPPRRGVRTFPLGGRWPAGPDEGAACGTFAVNGIPQSPPCGGDSPLSQGGRARMVRPVSPSVICFANATSLARGRLFRRFHPPYTPKTPPIVGRFHAFIGNRAVLRLFPDTRTGPPKCNAIRTVKTADRAVSYHRGAFSPLRAGG